ncbi:MAG: patatin-like phospholipase family protein, partial [Gammaproteobacteria bacterium]|nr:patatin-like phospholipase family protein [Gammaproteobacteria bacterium]
MLQELSKTGIILSGGGARAAYQVGVLKAIYKQIPKGSHNPFPIICGSSAGAINATVMAAYAGQYRIGLRRLESVWASIHVDKVFKSDFIDMFRHSSQFALRMLSGKRGPHFNSLLNNNPLRELLRNVVPFHRLQELISEGLLHAICVTCSDYSNGGSCSFFQGHSSIDDWQRHRRLGLRDNIHLSHLMASSAIPMVFPAVAINHQFFGDGSVGFISPISPALHLGADKILIIGLDPLPKDPDYICFDKNQHPSVADIAGHVLDSVFIDSLDSDLERLERINKTLDKIPKHLLAQVNLDLKKVETLVISPSKDLCSIATECADELPASTAFFLKRLGVDSAKGSNLLSYLLFEQGYCKKLIELGFKDALEKETEIRYFFRHLIDTDN